METYQYPPSYPDSGNSSPLSREIDFENPSSWEEQQNYKAKFMCSYGGKIQPRSHDNQLSYIGGDTKILAVDRNIKFQAFLSKLSTLCDCDALQQDISFKYQLPGEELDALISVTTEDDLEHMMHEYDRLYRPSSKPVRMRLFIFITPNSGSQPDPLKPNSNADFLFGLENKTIAAPIQPSYAVVTAKYHDPVPDLVAPQPDYPPRGSTDESVEIQRQLQRLQISESDQYRRSSDGITGSYATAAGGDYYIQKMPENIPRSNSPAAVHHPAGYWPENQFSGEGFPVTGMNTSSGGDQHVYMMPPPGSFYQTSQVMRPPMAQMTQGYYAVQRMASDGYREQPVYGGVPPQNVAFSSAVAQPVKPSAYQEGYGLVRPAGVAENTGGAGYAQVAYDSASGRHVYYTAPGGMVHAPQYQQGVSPVFSNDMRPAAVPVGQDPKVVNKGSHSQGSV